VVDFEKTGFVAGVDLAIVAGPGKGGSIRVPVGSSRVLGRDESADEHLGGDTTISRLHARLEHLVPGRLRVVDLDATNGVYVAGRRISEPTEIGPGDRVELGQTALMLEPVPSDMPSGPEPPQAPVASYLVASEEWDGPAAPLAVASEPTSPTPRPQPQPSVQSTQSAVASGPQRGRGHVRGVARSVQVRGVGDDCVLSFRVDQYDARGERLPPIGVELRGYSSGQLSDGEEVDVAGHWKDGTVRAERVINRTTGAQVKGFPGWRRIVLVAVILLFVCWFAFLAYLAITQP
jgi:hypothetical protein